MLELSQRIAMLAAIVAGSVATVPPAVAQEDYTRTAGGLTVYLGVMPAKIVKGQPTMRGGYTRRAS
jgi:hypothetical protein